MGNPCRTFVGIADISFAYAGADHLSVIEHFSPIAGHAVRDLRLAFTCAIFGRWEDESFGPSSLPEPLPAYRFRWTAGLDVPASAD